MAELDDVKIERDKALATVKELEEKLAQQPKFVAIRGAQPGDVVFLTPTRELSASESKHFAESVRQFSRETHIRIAILPVGFSVNAKPAEDEVCIYTPEDEGHGSGTPLHYDTGCQKRWFRPEGLELFPFCAHCGKPISEEPFSTEHTPKGE